MTGKLPFFGFFAGSQRRRGEAEKGRPDFRPAFLSDEVYTPSLRRSEGRRDQLGDRCPSRVASKTSLLTLNGQRNSVRSFIKTLPCCIWSKKFPVRFFPSLLHLGRYNRHRATLPRISFVARLKTFFGFRL